MGAKYAVELNQYYPNFYYYHGWNNMFNHWYSASSYIDLLKKYNNIVLFSGDAALEKSLYSKLHGINRQIDTRVDTTFLFEKTGEKIYEVTYDSAKGALPFKFLCDAESLDSTKVYFIDSDGLRAGNGNTQSSDVAKSGVFSSRITKEAPYGMTSILSEVNANEQYRISVWKYNNGNDNAGLVVAANDKEKLYVYETVSSKTGYDWHKIEIDLIVPVAAHMQDLKIYCLNNDTELPAYFDDLSIEKKE
jgi:hypothetical protein